LFQDFKTLISKLTQSTGKADRDNLLKLKDSYNACLDRNFIERVGLEPLWPVLKELDEKRLRADAILTRLNWVHILR
jgi:predicted metalloendopeptidase